MDALLQLQFDMLAYPVEVAGQWLAALIVIWWVFKIIFELLMKHVR